MFSTNNKSIIMSLTTDSRDPRLGHGADDQPVPQNEVYLVLSAEEIAKGFIRPVRRSYIHVGKITELKGGTIEPLSREEASRFGDPDKYVAFLRYPESESPLVGKALTQKEVDNVGKNIGGCGSFTTMNLTIAETYARDPKFYGATYCCFCQKHLPVNEFVWDGTNERVGS
ncbi:MAG TPA: hypothetical protein DCR40_10165 [Prolixibacteraceae bacterium]|nr:hypothetical protein [Prolixibacteraceae bacterium]